MDRIKLLSISVIVLFILNIATISFVFFGTKSRCGGKPNRHHHQKHMEGKHNPSMMISEKLKLDDAQTIELNQLFEAHKSKIESISDQIQDQKKGLFDLLKSDIRDEKLKNEILDKISTLEREKDALMFDHFENVKALCKPEQKEDFIKLMDHMERFAHKRGHRPPM